jgi:hypothetical protein
MTAPASTSLPICSFSVAISAVIWFSSPIAPVVAVPISWSSAARWLSSAW